MFRAPCAQHQEVKIALHSLWYHHTYRCDDTRGLIHLIGYVNIILRLQHPRVFVWILIYSNAIYTEAKYEE